MRRMLPLLLALGAIIAFQWWNRQSAEVAPEATEPVTLTLPTGGPDPIAAAYANQQSGVPVTGEGTVSRILDDDTAGGRHQRFILQLGSGQTVLVAHNIDLAPRIDALREGDAVAFRGEYEWNDKGGVVHWTHHDPQGQHADGWLKHGGRTYQ